MRKDDEANAELGDKGDLQGKPTLSMKPERGMDMEEELEDVDLLGQATLAKMIPPAEQETVETKEPPVEGENKEIENEKEL
jgi:hypothetical protein